MNFLNPMSGFPVWGHGRGTGNTQEIWPSGLAGFDYRPSRGLRETEAPVLEGTNKILHVPGLRGEEQWPHRRLNLNYLLGAGQQGLTTGTGALRVALWSKPSSSEFAINPTTEPADPRAGSPQAKQLSGRECNPTHEQIIRLMLYGARPCPPEQDPAFPITSPSHQEAYTSLLVSFIRGQTEEAQYHSS